MTSGLPTRTLGRTGLEVATLGYGGMALNVRSGPTMTTDEARRILQAVLDAGISLIDTSPDYGPSEELIGASIAGRRDEFVLASKCGCIVSATPCEGRRRKHVCTVDNVVAGVEQSLRRMRTDRIDVVQFHGSPSVADLEEHGAVEALQRLQTDGKGEIHRHVRRPTRSGRSHRHGRVRRVPDPLLPRAARARDSDHPGRHIRLRNHRPRRCGPGQSRSRQGLGHEATARARRRPAPPAVGAIGPRRPPRRCLADRVHVAVHALAPLDAHHHRRDRESRSSPATTSKRRARGRSPPTSTKRPSAASTKPQPPDRIGRDCPAAHSLGRPLARPRTRSAARLPGRALARPARLPGRLSGRRVQRLNAPMSLGSWGSASALGRNFCSRPV